MATISPSASPGPKAAVSISEQPAEEINLPPAATSGEPRAYRPSHLLRKSISSKRLQGRLPGSSPRLTATKDSLSSIHNVTLLPESQHQLSSAGPSEELQNYYYVDRATQILEKCAQWLEAERIKHSTRKERRRARKAAAAAAGEETEESSGSADESLDLLEALLQGRPTAAHSRSHSHSRRGSRSRSRRKSLLGAASDTEYTSDGEVLVPRCEEWLKSPEEIGMDAFKLEVLKLAHTLRCKRWRRVALERHEEVGVWRISGALTNAVYMVTPPPNISASHNVSDTASTPKPMVPPATLLLRIYGPQVEHLIDRDLELSILGRLARQKIGPRLLGTFINGRFEEFFTAHTLTKDDIRVPETSRHIAKRLKELHRGIDLESHERAQGPIVWKNWEKWVPRCNEVMATIDPQRADLVCGTTWPVFRDAVEKYREWLVARYGSEENLRSELVFAHNDTQYGNILRLQASDKSPLLLPSNEHRQLVVIDFEYASANTPGFEFANHFCEWMADYHSSTPHEMKTGRYPTDAEMRNFLTAYVEHSLGKRYSGVAVGVFNLDANPLDHAGSEEVEREVERLMDETRAWRAASSASWCAWGIVQAQAPVEGEEVKEEEFDYLLYAQQRALLFWGDCISLGVFRREEVEEMQNELVGRVKMVEVEVVEV